MNFKIIATTERRNSISLTSEPNEEPTSQPQLTRAQSMADLSSINPTTQISTNTKISIKAIGEAEEIIWTQIKKHLHTIKPDDTPSQSIDCAITKNNKRLKNDGNDPARLTRRTEDLEKIKTHFADTDCSDTFLGFVGWGEGCITTDIKPEQNVSEYQGFLYKNENGELCYQELGSSLILFETSDTSTTDATQSNTDVAVLTEGGRDFNFETKKHQEKDVTQAAKNIFDRIIYIYGQIEPALLQYKEDAKALAKLAQEILLFDHAYHDLDTNSKADYVRNNDGAANRLHNTIHSQIHRFMELVKIDKQEVPELPKFPNKQKEEMDQAIAKYEKKYDEFITKLENFLKKLKDIEFEKKSYLKELGIPVRQLVDYIQTKDLLDDKTVWPKEVGTKKPANHFLQDKYGDAGRLAYPFIDETNGEIGFEITTQSKLNDLKENLKSYDTAYIKYTDTLADIIGNLLFGKQN